jgi:hypothetical protein
MQGAPTARRFLQLGSKNDAKPTGENGCALNVQLANPLAEAIEAPRKRGRCVATHWPREAKRVVSAAEPTISFGKHQGRKTLGSNVLCQCNRKTSGSKPKPRNNQS